MKNLFIFLSILVGFHAYGQSPCSPVTTLDCGDLAVALPLTLDFNTSPSNTLVDAAGNGTGFTIVLEHSEVRRSGDLSISNPNTNGYESSLLTLGNNVLQLTSQGGIAFLDPPASHNNNNQINTLGVGLSGISSEIIVKAKLLDIRTGSGAAQAGIWFGYDEDNFVKLSVTNNNNIELRVESGGLSSSNDFIVADTGAFAQDVVLELVLNPNTLVVDANYTVGTNLKVLLGTLAIPADYFTGRTLGNENMTFAGIYTTDRGGAEFIASFDNFSVEGETATATNPSSGGSSVWNQSNTDIYFNSGNVGIGTSAITANLHLSGGDNDSELLIEADTNNSSGEDNNPWITLSQDSGFVKGFIGLIGNPNTAPHVIKYPRYESASQPQATDYPGTLANYMLLGMNNSEGVQLGSKGNVRLTVHHNGNVGIGTNNPDAPLAVSGRIHAEEVKVDLSVPGPDYVFKTDYELKSLEEVQRYIKENGHLPNIPSAKEMETNGIDLGAMEMKLLEKIEELTLYILQLQEKFTKLESQVRTKHE